MIFHEFVQYITYLFITKSPQLRFQFYTQAQKMFHVFEFIVANITHRMVFCAFVPQCLLICVTVQHEIEKDIFLEGRNLWS